MQYLNAGHLKSYYTNEVMKEYKENVKVCIIEDIKEFQLYGLDYYRK